MMSVHYSSLVHCHNSILAKAFYNVQYCRRYECTCECNGNTNIGVIVTSNMTNLMTYLTCSIISGKNLKIKG